MDLNSRQKQILEIIENTGHVKVSSLSQNLFFSEMTIRRDLKKMEKAGLLKRVHGGAVENESDFQYPISYRLEINKEQKKSLAALATRYLDDGQVIFLNTSSTLSYLIPYMQKYKNIRVITNSVHLLLYLGQMHIPSILTGGFYNEIEQCLVGRETEEFLRWINPDIAFLSCEALSEDGCVTDGNPDLAEIDKLAVRQSKKTVLLMDRSKVGSLCPYTVCRTDQLTDVLLL